MTDFCARCGADIDPSAAAYTGDGLVCKLCEAAEIERERRPFVDTSSFGPLGWGMLSLVCNPFMIPSIMAVSQGFSTLNTLKAITSTGGKLSVHDQSAKTNAIFGIVLGAFWPVMILGMVAAAIFFGVLGAVLAPEREPYDPYAYGDPYGTYDPDPYGAGAGTYGSRSGGYDPDPYGAADEPYGGDSYGVGGLGTLEDLDDAPAPAPEPESIRVELDPSRPVSAQLALHVRLARAAGMTPYVYTHASWCAPCRAVDASMHDPRMEDAFRNVYVIGADVDAIDDASLGQAGIHVRGIPAWYGIDARGRHDGRVITGGAWGADTPANMAGPLGGFFHPEG